MLPFPCSLLPHGDLRLFSDVVEVEIRLHTICTTQEEIELIWMLFFLFSTEDVGGRTSE